MYTYIYIYIYIMASMITSLGCASGKGNGPISPELETG